jgi:sulfur carrier protein
MPIANPLLSCKNSAPDSSHRDRMIALTINGEAHRFEHALNCRQLIERLHLAGKRIAIERNGEIVPRGRHAVEMLADGDRLEIVVAVGGG